MKSRLNLWSQVKSKKMQPHDALHILAQIPGAEETQTYRRILRVERGAKLPDAPPPAEQEAP